MEITFATKKLQKQLNGKRTMVAKHGPLRAEKLEMVLAVLKAGKTLAALAPPMSPPYRCHELTGDRAGQFTVDLDHPYRLVFRPTNDPLPMRPEGGLDWTKVTDIEIIKIEDTHG